MLAVSPTSGEIIGFAGKFVFSGQDANNQRVITCRGCGCRRRRPGGGAGVATPNSRSKNEGPE
jgi:hypothetical protein